MYGSAKNRSFGPFSDVFSVWLETVHTATDIAYWIIPAPTECRKFVTLSCYYRPIRFGAQAIAAQDRNGLVSIFRCIVVEWAGVQEVTAAWLPQHW
jgi:hypothetical protein